MLSQVKSVTLAGLDGIMVTVEADFANGLPSFDIVGLPDATVREARERVRAAVVNSGFTFPPKRAVVNLAPGDLRKEGTQFDLPIAMSVLAGSGQLTGEMAQCALLGELALSGELRPINGVLSAALCAKRNGCDVLIVPEQNASEAALVKGLKVYKAGCLADVYLHFSGEKLLETLTPPEGSAIGETGVYNVDFSEVKGQKVLRRGVEIAAAGGHNLIMLGSPGSGKSMIAKRIPTILPSMTLEEAMDVTKIHSLAGEIDPAAPLVTCRPFRAPHHGASAASVVGGGSKYMRPGEISMAHNGVLFMDEFPEFRKDVLEALRQPLEDAKITVSRMNATFTYPSKFMLVAAMNPCRCGFYGDGTNRCRCSESEVLRYRKKISGPLLDRIDIHLEAPSLKYDELQGASGESSSAIRERVEAARAVAAKRYANDDIRSNSELTGALIEKYCPIGEAEDKLLRNAFDTMHMSARAYTRVLKLARTIADLELRDTIDAIDIAEALTYRDLDRKYWG
ncbi:MAG: YifB family Mg chelatase-like AAA ATPase [Clostridia bacterium]|nr:YifB family Mg chelatase-like AAA ATPase [Clostridia bacterium]